MTSIPLHPALVHLPLGLAFVLPILVLGFTWALWKDRIQRRAWAAIIVLHGILLGAGFLALLTGERESQRIESVVPETAIETHEESAEQFLSVVGISLALASSVLVVSRPRARRALTVATFLGSLLVSGAALRVGHAGGKLVYVHNAAAAYTRSNNGSVQSHQHARVPAVREPAASTETME